MPNHLQQTEPEHSFKTTHSTPANDTDIAKIMGERSRYRRERLPSEQVEKLRTNFAFALTTRTPEPRLDAASETSQPVTISSSQPVLPKRKRKRNNTNVLRESKPRNTSPEAELDVAVETPQPTLQGPSLSTPPTQKHKRKRAEDFSKEREPNEDSPEVKSASGLETPRPITRGSLQPPARKPKRKSKMLRELDPHNESPEQDSELDLGILHESTIVSTRGAKYKVESFLKNEIPTPPKNLNFNRLMYTEFKGIPKETKTWYFPDNSNPEASSHQRQLESRQSTDVEIKQEDEEGILRENLVTSDRSRSQSKSTRRTMSQQSRKSSGTSRQGQAVAPESSWSRWDREKGQLSLNTALAVSLLEGVVLRDLPTLPPITLLLYLYIYQCIHKHV